MKEKERRNEERNKTTENAYISIPFVNLTYLYFAETQEKRDIPWYTREKKRAE